MPKKASRPVRRRGPQQFGQNQPDPAAGDGVPFSSKTDPELGAKLQEVRTVHHLLLTLGITEWDYLIIGDGSATRWTHEAGWASWLLAREGDLCQHFHGGFSCGTNIVSELMAVVHPLLYLSGTNQPLSLRRLHVLTDCEYLTQAGPHREARKKNRELWTVVDAMRQRGLRIAWHWIPRDTLIVNRYAHDAANLSREAMKTVGAVCPGIASKHRGGEATPADLLTYRTAVPSDSDHEALAEIHRQTRPAASETPF